MPIARYKPCSLAKLLNVAGDIVGSVKYLSYGFPIYATVAGPETSYKEICHRRFLYSLNTEGDCAYLLNGLHISRRLEIDRNRGSASIPVYSKDGAQTFDEFRCAF